MTKFESIGVARQYESRNAKEAKRAFENSCNYCCINGIHIECPRLQYRFHTRFNDQLFQ